MLTDKNRHSGSSYKTYLSITVKVLAEASGRCQETVRRHIKAGKLDPWQLSSIHDWLNKVGKNKEEDEDDGGS